MVYADLSVFVSSSDWFITLFMSVVSGQNLARLIGHFRVAVNLIIKSEAKCKVFIMKISFHSYANKPISYEKLLHLASLL